MEVLPLKSLREEDGPLVGADLLNLAKLSQNGFPVAEGIVVIPPDLKFRTIIEHFRFKDREVFEQSLHIVKAKILEIPIPLELETAIVKTGLDPKKLWVKLLEGWLEQIRSKIWREGFSPKLSSALTAEPVFFTKKISSSGEVYFDMAQKSAVISIYSGKLTPDMELDLEEIVKKADKKLFITQLYQWIIDSGKVKLVKTAPFTGFNENYKVKYKPVFEKEEIKPSVKIFLELGSDFKTAGGIDGIFIKGGKLSDSDPKIMQLVEAAASLPNGPVIFGLSDIAEDYGGVRGTLRLIHQSQLLKKDAEAITFARNKKDLLNISVAVPFVRSQREFLQIKRDLAVLGISRKGSLKLWLELAVPENLINLEDYVTAGFDGGIINLDEMAAWLGGFNMQVAESIFYKKQVNALLDFLEGGFKTLHKANIPILASGSLAMHDEVLAFLLEKGAWGIITDFSNILGTHEHLRFVEKRTLLKKAE